MNHEEVRNWDYQLNERNGVWIRPGYQSIDYSDGDDTERSIAEVVDRAQDLQLFSAELRAACLDWASTYHLSGVRANILRPFESRLRDARVLEIGAGCGAITRYLGEIGAEVVALEGTLRRASIARSRTRDQANVRVVCDRFGDFVADEKFDAVTLIGVLEYAPLFEDGPDPHTALLTRACELLKPGGQLIIAIENQLGLKYFAGAPEDHNGRVGSGIEGLYSGAEAETLGRVELQHKLNSAGFPVSEFFAPFPDYKFPTSIVTEAGWADISFDASAFAWQSVRKDPQLPPQLAFAPERTWPVVVRNGLGVDLSNSFLVVASKSANAGRDATLAYHYSTERRAEYCKETLFLGTPEGIRIRYRKVTDAVQPAGAGLRLVLPESADYVAGQLLSARMVQTLVQDGWTLRQFAELLRAYAKKLLALGGFTGQPELDSPVPGNLFDAVPQNIMLADGDRWVLIDTEWVHDGELPLGYLLFRALLLTLQGLTRMGVPADVFEYTRRGFMIATLRSAGFAADSEAVDGFARIEARLQSIVSGRQPSDHANWWADSPLIFENVFAGLTRTQHELARAHDKLEAAELAHQALEAHVAALDRSRTNLAAENAELVGERARLNAHINDQHALASRLDQNLKERETTLAQYQWAHARLRAPRILLRQTIKSVSQRLRLDRVLARLFFRGTVARSGLFDQKYYLDSYEDVRRSGKDPIIHYLLYGWKEGRDPSREFSTNRYLQSYFDVRLMGDNPLLHYLKYGRAEGRMTEPAVPAEQRRDATVMRTAAGVDVSEVSPPLKLIVPYFLDPYEQPLELPDVARVAIHVYLPRGDVVDVITPWLNQLPCGYDLLVSLPPEQSGESFEARLRADLDKVIHLRFREVPAGSLPIVALCRGFAAELLAYDLVAHLQVPDLQDAGAMDGFEAAMRRLLGSPQTVAQIWQRLKDDAALVYPGVAEPEALLQQRPRIDLSSLQPKGLIDDADDEIRPADYLAYPSFWLRPSRLGDWISRMGAIDWQPASAHAVVEQSVLPFAQASEGRSYKLLPQSQNVGDQTWYEDQRDYSSSVSLDVKVLAYYLPQFHPTSENDEWHGAGFTEWHKVASCNPLFAGHYQQHVPHSDIGYYSLTTADHLYAQAEMMRQAGVHGMIFYHYWFGGRMILEKPAQMLLSQPDIAMPYCFCWANENWTRRWDGNESEILLGQNYSADDARGFIEYLLPHFKDPRYIKVGQRPVLMVYRPSSVECLDDYIAVWAQVCEAAGVARPYVIATLTRGANSPLQYGMDGAVERVLHDWTDGAVPEIKQDLIPYWPINGRVLNYTDVADFYMQQGPRDGFDYFRSLVPVWDNTPRYQSEAYIVHGFSTRKFQEWLEFLIGDARERLPEDRRFVMINAWNEWAEGAHLEPDAAVGYGYLNTIGRALSGIGFDDISAIDALEPVAASVRLNPAVQAFFESDSGARAKFEACLQAAIEAANLQLTSQPSLAAFTLTIERPCLFGPDVLAQMRRATSRYAGFAMCTNVLNDPNFIDDGAPSSVALENSAICLTPAGYLRGRKICYQANTFVFAEQHLLANEPKSPLVGTVMRFHAKGETGLLFNALYSLLAQSDCRVKPWIGMQDVSTERISELETRIRAMPWAEGCQPEIRRFDSYGLERDLRAVMLNEGLKAQPAGYVGFLDYDDILYPDAYRTLTARLAKVEKAVTFGRVYTADVDKQSGRVVARRPVYIVGQTYEHFFDNNHAPLHSFLLDTRLIDAAQIQYFEEMKYMEDYFLTLQIFTPDSADWESLAQPSFIGDYNHRIGANEQHTLALSDEQRNTLLNSNSYQLCQFRIDQLRAKIRMQGHRLM